MKISIALLIYELKKISEAPELIYTELSNVHGYISGIRMFCTEEYQDDILYIASCDEIRSTGKLPTHIISAGMPQSAAVNGVVYINMSLVRLINIIERLFYDYNLIESDLYAAIAKSESLRTILSICARYFNNPITINDLRMKFVETSDNVVRELMPEYFKVVIDTGYIDIRIMQAMKKRGYDRLINSSKETLLFELEEIPVRYFSKNIYEDHQITACLVIHEVFSTIDIAQTVLVDQITHIIDNFAFKNPRGKQTYMNKVEQMIQTLLEGSKYNDDIHSLYLKQVNWSAGDGFYLIQLQVSVENAHANTAKYTFAAAQSFFPTSLIIEKDDNATIVICDSQIKYDLNSALEKLEQYLEERGDKAAVSRFFQNISYIHEHYTAVSMALKLGPVIDPGKHLFYYNQYSLPVMLKLCSREIDLRVFCMQEAITLHDYDETNNSEFFRSLYVYLKNNKSLVTAAKELKIHRNTLLYRLGRVKDIIAIDPSDDTIFFPMILSYEILHYRLKLEDTQPTK